MESGLLQVSHRTVFEKLGRKLEKCGVAEARGCPITSSAMVAMGIARAKCGLKGYARGHTRYLACNPEMR